jgi:hypothetical protein
MRDDSPAARITPPKLEARDMLRKIPESRWKVSDREKELVLIIDEKPYP